MDQKQHKIEIINVKANETLSYPLILLKGRVIDEPNAKCSAKTVQVGSNLHFSVTNRKFKLLYELETGRNAIKLTYCCFSTTFSVIYKARRTNRSVLPLFIVCDGHNGDFQAPINVPNHLENACARITTGAKLLQCLFAEKLHESGFERKTFHLEANCRPFYSKLGCMEARKLSQNELWTQIGRELASSAVAGENRKFLAFLSCTWYNGDRYSETTHKTHEDFLRLTEGYAALGGGGLALFGSHCLFAWPETVDGAVACFESERIVDRRELFDDSCYRRTFGACFSTTLGSVLHELCHSFDLGHTEAGIMGRGFDYVSRFFLPVERNQAGGASVEFREKFDETLSDRLLDKPNEFFLRKKADKEADFTFWTKSCTALLAYHQWFNDFASSKTIKFDRTINLISSTAGLRVVELRREEDGMVCHCWVFDGRVLKYSHQIDEIFCKKDTKLLLVVENNVGDLLKELIIR